MESVGNENASSLKYNSTVTMVTQPNLALSHKVLLGVMTATTTPANIIVIVSLLCEQKSVMTTGFKIFAISLACTDLSVGCIILPFQIYQHMIASWTLGTTGCLAYKIFDFGLGSVSVFLMTAMGLDRYKCITDPFSYRIKFSKYRIVLTSVILWIAGICVWIPGLIVAHIHYGTFVEGKLCRAKLDSYITTSMSVCVYCLPMILTVTVYAKIVLFLRRRLGSDPKISSNNSNVYVISKPENVPGCPSEVSLNSKINGQNKRCAITLFVVVALFIICWGPFSITWPIYNSCKTWLDANLYNTLSLMPYVNSTVNPFVYIASCPRFSVKIKKLLRRLTFSKPRPEDTQDTFNLTQI